MLVVPEKLTPECPLSTYTYLQEKPSQMQSLYISLPSSSSFNQNKVKSHVGYHEHHSSDYAQISNINPNGSTVESKRAQNCCARNVDIKAVFMFE